MRLLVIVLFLCTSAVAGQVQGNCRSEEIPVTVILPDGRVVRGLKPTDLSATMGKTDLTIGEASGDKTGRRIVLVDVRTPSDYQRTTTEIVRAVVPHLLAQSRPEDSFAMLTIGRETRRVGFSETRDALSAAIEKWGSERGGTDPASVLSSLRGALDLFGTPQPGDAMLVIGPDLMFDEKDYEKLVEDLELHGVRVFTLMVGPLIAGTSSTVYVPGAPPGSLPIFSYDSYMVATKASIYRLSWDTGGFVWQVGADPMHELQLTDEDKQVLQLKLWRMYGGIVDFYRVRLAAPTATDARPWKVALTAATLQKAPKAVVLYPRKLPPCSATQTPPADKR